MTIEHYHVQKSIEIVLEQLRNEFEQKFYYSYAIEGIETKSDKQGNFTTTISYPNARVTLKLSREEIVS